MCRNPFAFTRGAVIRAFAKSLARAQPESCNRLDAMLDKLRID
jgi:hypothetical protein